MLVAIEGLDGSGKSTIIKALSKILRKRGLNVFTTSEPTDGPIGKIIKQYLAKENRSRDIRMEALLFAADRIWHVNNVIKPMLEKGGIVITDRYKYSSLAYQAMSSKDEKWVEEINKFVPEANLAFFIDVTPENCIKRLNLSKRKKSIMENLKNLKKVYERYLKLVKRGKLIRINGEKDVQSISGEIAWFILEKLS